MMNTKRRKEKEIELDCGNQKDQKLLLYEASPPKFKRNKTTKTKTWDDGQKRRPKGEDERQFKQKPQTEIRRKLKKEETSPQKSKKKEE